MEAPITEIGHLKVGRIYSLYSHYPVYEGPQTEVDWETLPADHATYLGEGWIHGDLVAAIFRREDSTLRDEAGMALILVTPAELNNGTSILPFDE